MGNALVAAMVSWRHSVFVKGRLWHHAALRGRYGAAMVPERGMEAMARFDFERRVTSVDR